MRELKELKLEELSLKQKLGMTMTAHVGKLSDVDSVVELLKAHCLGAVWVISGLKDREEIMRRIYEAADYPVLVMGDAESGIGENTVGKHNAIGCTGSEHLAYMFGKVTGLSARQMGYNVICNPVLDMVSTNCPCGGTMRSYGKDKYQVTKLARAEAMGFHDAGVLTVAKHYPGKPMERNDGVFKVDSHMGENFCDATAEELIEYSLYPYIELNKEGLIDGVMLKHTRFVNIDPDYPASLSSKVIKLFRDQGFEGFSVTDGLTMMAVVAKFGKKDGITLSVGNGADLALPYGVIDNFAVLEALEEAYEAGIISDARLNEAATRVLAAQHKTLALPKYTDLTDEDIAEFSKINTESVFEKRDEGVAPALKKDGRYFFAVLTETEIDIENRDAIAVDTLDKGWYKPYKITDRLKEYFPNSRVETISEYPSRLRIMNILEDSIEWDKVVFVTFFNGAAYIGTECFTSRIISVMRAMQASDRISTILHCGNPFVLEDIPHIPRLVIATCSEQGVNAGIDVLAGKREARGVLTYDVKLP